jgi:hypothetical protein
VVPYADIHPPLNSFLSGNQRVWVGEFFIEPMFSVDGSGNMGSPNKNIANNDGRSATYADISADLLTEEFSGIV